MAAYVCAKSLYELDILAHGIPQRKKHFAGKSQIDRIKQKDKTVKITPNRILGKTGLDGHGGPHVGWSFEYMHYKMIKNRHTMYYEDKHIKTATKP